MDRSSDPRPEQAETAPGTPVVLRDGTTIELLPMSPEDAARLVRFHHTLSSETIYLRFFSVHPELNDRELHRFTNVDHRVREAIVAAFDGEIIAVARFDRLSEESNADAEVAFVVADPWQGRGLGRVLFDHLADRARALGVTRFVAETLAHNAQMLALFRHTGLAMTQRFEGSVVHVTIDLGPGIRSE